MFFIKNELGDNRQRTGLRLVHCLVGGMVPQSPSPLIVLIGD